MSPSVNSFQLQRMTNEPPFLFLSLCAHISTTTSHSFDLSIYPFFFVVVVIRLCFRYDGEESLLQGSSTESGFYAAAKIASMALDSSALHLETGGACLVAALLDPKNLPVPVPLDRTIELIRCCVKSLAPPEKKSIRQIQFRQSPLILILTITLSISRWKTETGRVHLQCLTRMLSAATTYVRPFARR